MTKNKAYLFFWKGNFMYIGMGIQTAIHDHHAVQLIIDFDGNFGLQLKSKEIKKFKCVLIDSDVPHNCITKNDRMLILNIVPESNIGKKLKTLYLHENGLKSINNKLTNSFASNIIRESADGLDEKRIVTLTETYLYDLSKTSLPLPLDDRIANVIELLSIHKENILTIKEIAAHVFLSESRLIHLFSSQVGIPIRKYLLWLRLVKAIQKTFQNNNITQAALDAGFSDAPHFNKTLKRMLGLNFSDLKNNQLLQAYWL